MLSLRSPLWIAVGFMAGLALTYLFPIAISPIPLFIAHALAIFHVALGLPLLSFGRVVGSGRVWRALLVLNLVVVPGLAFVLSRILWRTPDLQVGLLLALLAPGVALSIPIIRRAGGDAESVLGITPLLLAGQLVVVPPLAIVLSGGQFHWSDLPDTFIPIIWVVALPVALAALFQFVGKRLQRDQPRQRLSDYSVLWMSIAFFLTAWVVGSSHQERLGQLAWIVPLAIAFLVLMAPISLLVAGLVGVTADRRRAILIAAAGRGGVVMVPITLALGSDYWGFLPLVVITQASVEAVGLVVYRTISPEIVPGTQ